MIKTRSYHNRGEIEFLFLIVIVGFMFIFMLGSISLNSKNRIDNIKKVLLDDVYKDDKSAMNADFNKLVVKDNSHYIILNNKLIRKNGEPVNEEYLFHYWDKLWEIKTKQNNVEKE